MIVQNNPSNKAGRNTEIGTDPSCIMGTFMTVESEPFRLLETGVFMPREGKRQRQVPLCR